MKDDDERFSYKYEVDESNKLRSLLCNESQCQSDYENFGDVLTFDTTYCTNVYKRSLVVLDGVNKIF